MKISQLKKVHFVGIGGIGMSALALHLAANGVEVSGSDRTCNQTCLRLERSGVCVKIGHFADNVPRNCDLVVTTDALFADNVEVARAKSLGIEVVGRAQLLGKIFDGFPVKIAVCGTHGKTTVCAMLDYVLRKLKVDHASFIGGAVRDTHSNYTCGRGVVVAEACEYKRNFLQLHPDVLVCLNTEWDHPDCYPNAADMSDAYASFFKNVAKGGVVLANSDDVAAALTEGATHKLFGCKNADYTVKNVVGNGGTYSFDFCDGKNVVAVSLPIYGKHNVYNAAATLAVVSLLGQNLTEAASALATFPGVERRFVTRASKQGFLLAVDYAHHPTEIAASIVAAREASEGGKVVVVFQPHTYSRTRFLWEQFARCFVGADVVAMLPVYAAREKPACGVDSQRLLDSVVGVDEKVFLCDFDKAATFVASVAQKGDVVLLLGAGDVNEIAEKIP